MSTPRPIRADAARNRDAIVAAARVAFDRGELDRRFDDFASLAGVGTGTLYRHFPTRELLAEAVYRAEVQALCQHARQLLVDGPPVQALATFLHDFVDRTSTRPGLARTLADLMRQQPEAQAHGARALKEALDNLVTAATRDGGVGPEVTVGVVMTALHGIGSSYGRPGWQADAKGLISVLIQENARPATARDDH